MNMCLLGLAMCEKCRSSHFQSEGEVKSLRTGGGVRVKHFRTGRLLICYFCWWVSTPLHAMRLRLGLSRLREHKFNHNFQNCINPLCSCAVDIESTSHFFLPYLMIKESLPEHSTQNRMQSYRGEWIFFHRNATVWQFIFWFEKTPLFLCIHWWHSIY